MTVAYAGVLSGHGATSYANNNLDASHSIEQYNHDKDYYVILIFFLHKVFYLNILGIPKVQILLWC